jgi:hypothetical protein
MALVRWRRLFQFGLGTVFVVLTILCISLGILTNRVHRQQRAVAAIEKVGGTVGYARSIIYDARGEPLLPSWNRFKTWLGPDWFESVCEVTLWDKGCNDATLEYVKELPDLRWLSCHPWYAEPPVIGIPVRSSIRQPPGITDVGVKIIASLKRLERVRLYGNQVTDIGLGYLHHHPALRSVAVDRSCVTDEGFRALMETLDKADYRP